MTISKGYQDQLTKEHNGSKWGTTGARYSGQDVLELLRNRPYIRSVLDYGAGKGELGRFILNEGIDVQWTNYDPGIPAYNTLPSGQFDLVITTDVLEHVEPDNLEEVIRTLSRLTGKVLFSDIACYPTGKVFGEGPYKGQDLHLIVEDPSWWRTKFAAVSELVEAEYQWREKVSKGAPKKRCMMVHERV